MTVIYHIVRGFFYLLSLLPYRVIYFLSDALYLLIYHVVRYRRKVVRGNLTSSFPEKTTDEIKQIERKFYHHLCDYFLETIKLLSTTHEDILKHVEFHGVEEFEKCFDRGQSCSILLGHYSNWEYLPALFLKLQRHPDVVQGMIYHPLRSDVFDRLFLDMRQRLPGVCIAKKSILRKIVELRREKRLYYFGYISDQSPKWENIHLWLPFLNHDTPVFTNGEKIMRKMNEAVFYIEMRKVSRGHYASYLTPITYTPNELEENAITRRFFEMLEETIRRDPSLYLWTHNRWKRTHEEFDKRFKTVNGKVIPR